jgi:N-acetylglucosaminyl-diphospho-decaprenol L-rhamnosyltransferase
LTQRPRCAVVVVSYNSESELPACLDAIEAQQDVDVELHVVDNASSDASVDLVRRRNPRAHLIANVENRGFARANNQILLQFDAPFFALVNPDTIIPPRALTTCLERLQRESDVGVVGCRLVYPDGRFQATCHAFLGLWNLLLETLLLDRLILGLPRGSSPAVAGFDSERIMDVDWIRGAFLVLRRQVRDEVGAFDANFFMYGEEMEWCYRIRKGGWRVVSLPEPPVVHVEGASSRPIAGPMFVETLKGRLRFLRKHRGTAVTACARMMIAISVLARSGARELALRIRNLAGQSPSEDSLLRIEMFRAAVRWVFQGLPLSPPGIISTRANQREPSR